MGMLELVMKVGLVGSNYAFFPNWILLPEFVGSPFLQDSFTLPIDGWMWFLWLVVVFIGFGLLFIFVSVASQGALVHSTAQFVRKKKLLDIDVAWQAGTKHFWRLFFLNLLKKIALLAFAILMGFATVNVIINASGADFIIFVLLFILVVIVGMILSFLAIYAAGYVVVEEYSLGNAIEAAWKLFLDHWLVSIEVGLIILFLNIVLGVVVLASFFLLFLPTLFLWVIAIQIVSSTLYFIAMMAGLALFLLFIVFAGSVFSVFTTASWTYLFMKMHKHGIGSRVLGWAGFHS